MATMHSQKGRNPTICLDLNKKDVCVLEYFRSFIAPDKPLCYTTRGDISFSFNSKEVAEDLSKYHIVPRKTGKEKFPKELLGDFTLDWFRGLFDGDGSVFVRYNKNQDTYYINFELCSASEYFLLDIKSYFNDYGRVTKFKGRKAYRWCVNANEELKDIYGKIYQNESVFCLKRKRDIFKRVFDNINIHKDKKWTIID